MTVRYRPNQAGIGRLMRSEEMLAVVTEVAAKGLAHAVEISPVGPPRDPHRGELKAGWRLETTTAGGDKHDRAEARIVNDAGDRVLADKVDGHDVLGQVLDYIEEQGR